MSALLDRVEAAHPALFAVIGEVVDDARVEATLRAVADTPAPSQTASLTRGAVVARLLAERGVLGGQPGDHGAKYLSDAHGSGCDLLVSGAGGLRVVAHLDEISYLPSGSPVEGRWPVTAYCYHLADGPRPARAVRYEPPDGGSGGGYQVVAHGEVGGVPGALWFEPGDGARLEPGDRVALAAPLAVEPGSGRVTGSLDNAAGVAAGLLAAEALACLGVPFSLLLTDEEEGPAGTASQTISRGAVRAHRHLAPAPLTAVVDIHGLAGGEQARTDGHRRGWGASLVEFSSAGRGVVTPPHLYRPLVALAAELRGRGVEVRQNVGGYVPRSDDVAAMLHSPLVCLLGYPGSDRHFDRGLPAVNLGDLRHLAGALTVLGAAVDAGVLTGDRR